MSLPLVVLGGSACATLLKRHTHMMEMHVMNVLFIMIFIWLQSMDPFLGNVVNGAIVTDHAKYTASCSVQTRSKIFGETQEKTIT